HACSPVRRAVLGEAPRSDVDVVAEGEERAFVAGALERDLDAFAGGDALVLDQVQGGAPGGQPSHAGELERAVHGRLRERLDDARAHLEPAEDGRFGELTAGGPQRDVAVLGAQGRADDRQTRQRAHVDESEADDCGALYGGFAIDGVQVN